METELFLVWMFMVVVVVALNTIAWSFFRRPDVDPFGQNYTIWLRDLNKYLLPRGVFLVKIARVVAALIVITLIVAMGLRDLGWTR